MANVWKKISLKAWKRLREDFVESMANLNGVGSFHEFQRRFRWKYGQLERRWEFPRVPRVSKKISLKVVWPTFERRFRWKHGQRLREDFVESMANLNGVGSSHEFQRRFRWKYGQLERRWEFPRVPRVSKKISLKVVWPTFERRFRWKHGQRLREDFVESMANLNGLGSFHEFHEFQRRFRWKYGQLEREREMKCGKCRSTTFWEQTTPTSLEMEEINPKQEQAYVSFSGEMKCGKCWSTTFLEQATHTSLEDQPLFESKQRILAWKLKKFRFV